MKQRSRLVAVLKSGAPVVAAAVVRAAPLIATDGAGLIGAGLLSYGFWLGYPPAGFIVGGGLLMLGALLAGRARAT